MSLFQNKSIVRKCRRIANVYGERYKKEIMNVTKLTPKLLADDWFVALKFWFGKSFFRGRLDSISEEFMNKAWSAISSVGKNKILKINMDTLNKSLINAEVNNHFDRKMVLESLKFLQQLKDHNMATYAYSSIKQGNTLKIYSELNNIFAIGPKLASLYLRDICFIYKIEPLDKEQLLYLQPVDTWVRQVAIELGIPGCTDETNTKEVVTPIVDFCVKNHISPLLFNAGAWYVGAKSFKFILELL